MLAFCCGAGLPLDSCSCIYRLFPSVVWSSVFLSKNTWFCFKSIDGMRHASWYRILSWTLDIYVAGTFFMKRFVQTAVLCGENRNYCEVRDSTVKSEECGGCSEVSKRKLSVRCVRWPERFMNRTAGKLAELIAKWTGGTVGKQRSYVVAVSRQGLAFCPFIPCTNNSLPTLSMSQQT